MIQLEVTRDSLVDSKLRIGEREVLHTIFSANDYSSKFFGWRFGKTKNTQNVVCGGIELAYKYSRVVRSEAGFVDFYKGKGSEGDTFSNRKHKDFKVLIEKEENKNREAHI